MKLKKSSILERAIWIAELERECGLGRVRMVSHVERGFLSHVIGEAIGAEMEGHDLTEYESLDAIIRFSLDIRPYFERTCGRFPEDLDEVDYMPLDDMLSIIRGALNACKSDEEKTEGLTIYTKGDA